MGVEGRFELGVEAVHLGVGGGGRDGDGVEVGRWKVLGEGARDDGRESVEGGQRRGDVETGDLSGGGVDGQLQFPQVSHAVGAGADDSRPLRLRVIRSVPRGVGVDHLDDGHVPPVGPQRRLGLPPPDRIVKPQPPVVTAVRQNVLRHRRGKRGRLPLPLLPRRLAPRPSLLLLVLLVHAILTGILRPQKQPHRDPPGVRLALILEPEQRRRDEAPSEADEQLVHSVGRGVVSHQVPGDHLAQGLAIEKGQVLDGPQRRRRQRGGTDDAAGGAMIVDFFHQLSKKKGADDAPVGVGTFVREGVFVVLDDHLGGAQVVVVEAEVRGTAGGVGEAEEGGVALDQADLEAFLVVLPPAMAVLLVVARGAQELPVAAFQVGMVGGGMAGMSLRVLRLGLRL
mmetsp:Transcript_2181/g.4691  ORF Transcript_2181/g.4691 Transcript_2181/m.4691 type:complete len:397 (+) Transcript_2181:2156-3346(+)